MTCHLKMEGESYKHFREREGTKGCSQPSYQFLLAAAPNMLLGQVHGSYKGRLFLPVKGIGVMMRKRKKLILVMTLKENHC